MCGFDPIAEAAALREEIGYMPQRFGLYEDLSVLENLTLYADLRGVVGQARKETFERLLAFTDLARFTDRRAGALSGGMKQKLGLACAMLRSPRLLLLDEPSVGVDPISRRELWRMVYALIDQGVGVVWSTAYLDEAENCAEVLVLNEGRVLYQGDPKAMTASVAGRVFQLRGAGARRRELLARALEPARGDRRRHAGRGDPPRRRRGQAAAHGSRAWHHAAACRRPPSARASRTPSSRSWAASRSARSHVETRARPAQEGPPPVEAQRPHPPLRHLHGGGPHHLHHRARRDFRPAWARTAPASRPPSR